MSEKKNQRYIITEFKPGLVLPEFRGKPGTPTERSHFMMWLGDQVVKGSPYVEAVWLWKGAADPSTLFPQHVHDHDEVLAFFGTGSEDAYDLGGEIELWLEDEKYLLTRSCLVFVPKGMKHCPIAFKRIDRPIFHFLIVTGGEYT